MKSSAASQNYGSCGTNFFVGSPRNVDSNLTYLKLMVFACEYVPVSFSVRTADSIIYSGEAFPTRATTVNLPINLTIRDSTYSNRYKGLQVSSLNGYPMSVLVMSSFEIYCFGEYLAHHCPPPAWQEYEYFILSTGSLIGTGRWSLALLVACHNDTTITITPTHDFSFPADVQGSTDLNITINSGDSHTFTLHELQTLLTGKTEVDITGTRIVSNKPLSVVGGNECGTVPTNLPLCEPLLMQVPPTATWGKRFLVPPVPWRLAPHMIKLVVAQNDTNLTHTCASNSSSITMLGAGESYFFMAPQHAYCSVISSHPILVAQLGVGHFIGYFADPSITIVPPIEHYTTLRVSMVALNLTQYPHNYLTYVVPAENISSFIVFFDNYSVPGPVGWDVVTDHNGTVLGYGHLSYVATEGVHTLQRVNPLATLLAIVNGFAGYSAYAYTPAMDIRPLNPGKSV